MGTNDLCAAAGTAPWSTKMNTSRWSTGLKLTMCVLHITLNRGRIIGN